MLIYLDAWYHLDLIILYSILFGMWLEKSWLLHLLHLDPPKNSSSYTQITEIFSWYYFHFFYLCRKKNTLSSQHVSYFSLNCYRTPQISFCPVGWGCVIHWLHLCRGVRFLPNECPGYDTKQSDGEVPVMLEFWGMWSTLLLPLLPGLLWPGVVAPDKGPISGLNRTNCILMLNWIVWVNWIAWNRNDFDNWTVLTFKLILSLC